MNLLTMSNRKRQRSDEPDFDQSLPISKRINQLHIRQSYNGSNSHESSDNTLWSGNNNDHWNSFPQQVTAPDHGFVTGPHSSATDFHLPFSATTQDPAFYDPQAFSRLVPADDPRTAAYSVPVEDPNTSRYDPELSELENPFYYTANECLFYLHMERLRRQRNV